MSSSPQNTPKMGTENKGLTQVQNSKLPFYRGCRTELTLDYVLAIKSALFRFVRLIPIDPPVWSKNSITLKTQDILKMPGKELCDVTRRFLSDVRLWYIRLWVDLATSASVLKFHPDRILCPYESARRIDPGRSGRLRRCRRLEPGCSLARDYISRGHRRVRQGGYGRRSSISWAASTWSASS